MTVEIIAILGAGQMGGGVAQVCAMAGFRAELHDANPEQLNRAINSLAQNLRRLAEKEKISKSESDSAIQRVTLRPEIGPWLNRADFAIEAVAENASVKTAVLQNARAHMRGNAVIATNTSSIPVAKLAANLPQPQNFIGMHFMNPVPLMPLVEVVPGAQTCESAVAQTEALARALGKTTVRSADRPGFIANRILMPMLNEAFHARMENLGGVKDIDIAMRLGMNHPMGPLQLADFIGLDTCLAVLQTLHEGFNDPKFRPCPLLAQMVAAGRLGKKSGVGFYDHRGERPVPVDKHPLDNS